MALTIVPYYAAALTLIFMALSIRVIRFRRATRIPLGDAGKAELQSRIRAQGNFVEYGPLGLILLIIAEMAGAGDIWLHLAGACLVLGRLVHGWHLGWRPTAYTLRPVAIILTFTSMLLSLGLGLPL